MPSLLAAAAAADPAAAVLATCVAVNAKKRNKKVPKNSPHAATKWLRTLFGKNPTPGSLSSFALALEGVSRRFMKGSCMKLDVGFCHEVILVLVMEVECYLGIERDEDGYRSYRCRYSLSYTEEGSVYLSRELTGGKRRRRYKAVGTNARATIK